MGAMAEPILARATLHLPGGIFPGEYYWVDPGSDYIQSCLAREYFVPVDGHAESGHPEGTPEDAVSPEAAQAAEDEDEQDGHAGDAAGAPGEAQESDEGGADE